MFKKAIPLVLVSGLALAGCGNNDVPNNNETPMEELDNGLRDMTPRVNNGAGPDMDGIDNGNGNGNNVNDGIINDDNRYDGNMNGDNGMDDGIITDDGVTTPDDTQMDRNQRDGMNNR